MLAGLSLTALTYTFARSSLVDQRATTAPGPVLQPRHRARRGPRPASRDAGTDAEPHHRERWLRGPDRPSPEHSRRSQRTVVPGGAGGGRRRRARRPAALHRRQRRPLPGGRLVHRRLRHRVPRSVSPGGHRTHAGGDPDNPDPRRARGHRVRDVLRLVDQSPPAASVEPGRRRGRGDRVRRARRPPRAGQRPRPRPPRRHVQRHGRRGAGEDRARGPVRVRRQPRAAVADHRPVGGRRGARRQADRAPRAHAAGARRRRQPGAPVRRHGDRPARAVEDRRRRHRLAHRDRRPRRVLRSGHASFRLRRAAHRRPSPRPSARRRRPGPLRAHPRQPAWRTRRRMAVGRCGSRSNPAAARLC